MNKKKIFIFLFFISEAYFSGQLGGNNNDLLLKDSKRSNLLRDFFNVLFFKEKADCNWLTSFMCDK